MRKTNNTTIGDVYNELQDLVGRWKKLDEDEYRYCNNDGLWLAGGFNH